MATLPSFLAVARPSSGPAAGSTTLVDLESIESLRLSLLEQLSEDRAFFLRLPVSLPYSNQQRGGLEAIADRLARSYQRVINGKVLDAGLWPLLDALRYAMENEGHAVERAMEGKRTEALAKNNEARQQTSLARMGESRDESARKGRVYDRLTGRSRYDAIDTPELVYPLRCPKESCGEPGDYLLSPKASTRQFHCHSCRALMTAYIGCVQELEKTSTLRHIDYRVQCTDFDGTKRALRFEAAFSSEPMPLMKDDLVAVIYDEDHRLCIVRNITRGGEVWVAPGSRCFVATAATGPFSPEVSALRHYREEVLRPRPLGRLAIFAYETLGPYAAAWIHSHPNRRRLARLLVKEAAKRLNTKGIR